ncbi:hypothetical protein HPB51_013361 [Rhipicephalus microplus]|uniref:PiggyBac transposable element-derived protein domain-containing protein n=1 Tax=Rhipicephalus microplus TaxID=6941 RepID=A0A9J6EGJ3_RHIMP|nr:hypothetical protein HPB51_013361 [Rhipicephalus microplus]
MWVRNDDKQVVVRWYDNKPVTLMSSLHGKEPQDTCRRWCAKEKRDKDVPRPHIVQAYNANMGGVDMADRMLSFYRMKARVKKWIIRCIFHLFDIALCNAWILYMQDMSSLRKQKKDILKFLDLWMSVADVLVAQMSQLSSDDDDALWSPPEKRAPLPPSESCDCADMDDHVGDMPSRDGPKHYKGRRTPGIASGHGNRETGTMLSNPSGFVL